MFVVLDTNDFAELMHDTGAGTKLKFNYGYHSAGSQRRLECFHTKTKSWQ